MLCPLYGPALTILCDHWEDHSLEFRDLVMFLLFNTQSRFVMLSCQERIVLFYGCSLHPQNLRTQEGETCHYFHLFPFYLLGNNGARCHDLTLVGFLFFFLIFSFKLAFSLSTFILIRRFFSSSSLSAIRVVPSHISGC